MKSMLKLRAVGPACGLALCLVAGGCATTASAPLALIHGSAHVRASVLPTQDLALTARPEGCYLDLVLDRSPERPFIVSGQVTAVWVGTDRRGLQATDQEALTRLRQEACRAGAHVLFQFHTQIQDQWVPTGGRGGTTFSRTVLTTALMAVYVNRDGSPTAPPETPRRVIRIPTPVEMQAGTALPASSDEAAALAWGQGITDPWAVPAD